MISKRFKTIVTIKMVDGKAHKIPIDMKLEKGMYPPFNSFILGREEFLKIAEDRVDGGKDILVNTSRIDTIEMADIDCLEAFNKLGDD